MVAVIFTGSTSAEQQEAELAKEKEIATFQPISAFRAVYDIALKEAGSQAGLAALAGRMVYELNGSACDGYALTHRFVTRVDLTEGQTSLTDLRSASFEDPKERSFQFITQTLVDQDVSQAAKGYAIHGDDKTALALSEPIEQMLDLPKDILFPVEFTQHLLTAAVKGDSFFEASIFDGTETGNLVFHTTAVIGLEKSHGNLAKDYAELEGLKHWPVTIAYFETGQDKDMMAPVYEISMELYENGVSGAIEINYPDFSLSGSLSELTLLDVAPCAGDENTSKTTPERAED